MTASYDAAADRILQLANTANPGLTNPLTRDNVQLDAPIALTGDPTGKNTKVSIQATQDQGYSGSVAVTYNRIDLQTQVADVMAPGGVSIMDGSYTAGVPYATIGETVAGLVDILGMEGNGLHMEASDLTNADEVIDSQAPYPKTIVLNLVDSHLSLIGTLTASIVEPA